jgi:UDP-glucose 4-epimerase
MLRSLRVELSSRPLKYLTLYALTRHFKWSFFNDEHPGGWRRRLYRFSYLSQLVPEGYTPIVFDSLVNGHRELVQWGPFEQGDVRDRERLDQVISTYKPAAIVHFAGLIEVSQSISDPVAFFESNVSGSITLFAAALHAGIDGIPRAVPIREDHPQSPINPYGRSKLMVEQILGELGTRKKFRSVILRYFNAAGADPEGCIGEWHRPETHVIPLAIEAARSTGQTFKVFGSDYPTRDGTCIRDFIHVSDLAEAHSRGIDHLIGGGQSIALNLGTGHGTSVKEIVAAIELVSNRRLRVEYEPRREGDPPELVADNALAKATLGWEPRSNLTSIVESAWKWRTRSIPRAKGKPIMGSTTGVRTS